MQATPNRRGLALVALAALALIWGYNWVVMKIAVENGPPFAFAAWRTLGGGIALLLVALATRRPLRPQYLGASFWIGIFQTAAFVGLVTLGAVTAGAGQVAMLAYTMPLWVTLIAWPALGERLRVPQAMAIAVAFAGVACMIGPLRSVGFAELYAVLAGFAWAIGIILTKRLARRGSLDLFGLTMWQMLVGGVALAIVAAFAHEPATVWSTPYTLAVAYNILFPTALAYVLFIFVLDTLPARDASMGTLANPIVGVLAAWLQLGERPSMLSAIGMVLILGGLVALMVADRPESVAVAEMLDDEHASVAG